MRKPPQKNMLGVPEDGFAYILRFANFPKFLLAQKNLSAEDNLQRLGS